MSDKLTFLSSKEFKKVHEESDSTGNLGIRKQFIPDSIKQDGDEDSRLFDFVISTDAVDRDNDTVNPKGWDLKQFRKNPVVLFAHDGRRPPIGRGSKVKVEDGKLKARVEFMTNDIDTSGFSDSIFRMVRGGFLRATSVGFLPKDFEFTDDEDRGGGSFFGGIDFLKQELLEFSIVPVPSNPEALLEARAKGIDTEPLLSWFEEALESWAEYKGMLLVPRKQIEQLYKTAKGGSTTVIFNLSKADQADLAEKNLKRIKDQSSEDDEQKDIVPTDSENGHTHEVDDQIGGVSGPGGDDEHEHAYEFGDEKTAPGGSDAHQHGLPEFQSPDAEEDDKLSDDDTIEKDDSSDNGIRKYVNQVGDLLIVDLNDGVPTEKVYMLQDLLDLQESDKEFPPHVTENDIIWVKLMFGEDKSETVAEKEEVEEKEEEKIEAIVPIKLKIVTDGSVTGTKIYDSETDRPIDVESAVFNIDGESKRASVHLVLSEAIIELQYSPEPEKDEEEKGTERTGDVIIKSEETDIEDVTVDDVLKGLEPEKVNKASEDEEFSDDDILNVVKEVIPDMLREIVKTEIGRLKGRL